MSVIVHPLTAMDGSPTYTADDYRHAVNPLMLPSNGSPFDGVQGVRYGSPRPLSTIEGLKVTVKPHSGTVSPWAGAGGYTYCITSAMTVDIADSTNNYKIAVVIDDPSQAHGSVPRGRLRVFTAGTPDSNIPGLVIAKVSAGSISDVAPMIRNSSVIIVNSVDQLDDISAVKGQEAVVLADDSHHVYADGSWHNTVEVSSHEWLGGTISFLYGATSCTVQVSGVSLDAGSWASSAFSSKLKEEYRPPVEISVPLCVENGGSTTSLMVVTPDGVVSVKNMGGAGSNGRRRGSASWPVSRRY